MSFCFRSLTRAETVRLETLTEDEAEASSWPKFIFQSIGGPPSAFAWLRPAVFARWTIPAACVDESLHDLHRVIERIVKLYRVCLRFFLERLNVRINLKASSRLPVHRARASSRLLSL